MTDNPDSEDLPKVVASVMVMVPQLAIKTGWAYLKMRKRAHKMSRQLEQQFVAGGIPSEYAAKLAEQFGDDLSFRRIVRDMNVPFGAMRR